MTHLLFGLLITDIALGDCTLPNTGANADVLSTIPGVVSMRQCQLLCQQNVSCIASLFLKSQALCYLSNTIYNRVAINGTTFAPKYCRNTSGQLFFSLINIFLR